MSKAMGFLRNENVKWLPISSQIPLNSIIKEKSQITSLRSVGLRQISLILGEKGEKLLYAFLTPRDFVFT